MTYSVDPIGAGFITSLPRPEGNITGLTGEVTAETWGKRLTLATEVAPAISRVAVVWNPDVPAMRSAWGATENAARKLGIALLSLEVRKALDVETAFNTRSARRKKTAGAMPCWFAIHPRIFHCDDDVAGLRTGKCRARERLRRAHDHRDHIEMLRVKAKPLLIDTAVKAL
jgi:hypothetical protein